MRIRHIIRQSLILPFREYKTFLIVYFLALLCEVISMEFYSIKIGQLSLVVMIVNSMITLMIVGVMINLTNNVVNERDVNYLDFRENLVEGIKEYIITFYYMISTLVLSSFFIVPTGVYVNFLHIHEHILEMDINTTFLTIHELSKDIPVSLRLDFYHSLQLNVLISIFIFVIFFSFAFIGKIVLIKTGNLKKALDPRIIHHIIRNIGYKRYMKFVFPISFIIILLFNLLYFLGYYLSDVLISALMESYLLFFATNSFYKIIMGDED